MLVPLQLHLEEKISIGLIAVAHACCEPVLQSSIQQWGSYIALTSVALLWCCITANLYEEKISIGVIAVAQAYCEPVLQSSIQQLGSYIALTSAAVQ